MAAVCNQLFHLQDVIRIADQCGSAVETVNDTPEIREQVPVIHRRHKIGDWYFTPLKLGIHWQV